jgi:hypothetical protein
MMTTIIEGERTALGEAGTTGTVVDEMMTDTDTPIAMNTDAGETVEMRDI